MDILKHYGFAVLIAVFLALFIRFFLIEAYRIPVVAMRPTLEAGDTIFVSKWDFGIFKRKPRYGEVILFSPPEDPGVDYIKRVVGLSGDTVEIKNGKVILNSQVLEVPTSTQSICGKEKILETVYPVCWEPPLIEDREPLKIPQDSIFVLADLRTQLPGKAKRGWRVIPLSSLKGKPRWIWLSITPSLRSGESSWFSRIRFERMFRDIQ